MSSDDAITNTPAAPQTNTEVTKEEALSAIGKVWAGNAGEELWRPFRAGDYAKARDIAARKVAEQDAKSAAETNADN